MKGTSEKEKKQHKSVDFESFKNQVLAEYKLACLSREAALLGRQEGLTGKAKFGIFGDGKELAQIALAKEFKNGDFRSGYYRDQTFMLSLNEVTPKQFFAGLYAHTDINQIYSKYSFQKNINKYIFSKNEIQYSTNKNNDFAPVTGLWKTLTQSEKFKLKSNTSIQLKELFKTKYEPSLSIGFEYKKLNFTQLVKDKRFGDGDQMQGEYNNSYSAEFIYPLENLQFECYICYFG